MRKNYLKGVLLFIIMAIGVCLATTMFTKDNIEKLSEGLETQYSNGRAYEPGEAGYAIVKIINIHFILNFGITRTINNQKAGRYTDIKYFF